MLMNWESIGSIIAMSTLLGGVIMGWFKLSRDVALNSQDIGKLNIKTDRLEIHVVAHDADLMKHRNPDSEQRIKDLMEKVDRLIEANSREHKDISSAIAGLKR
jgi:hypothetical protein